MSALLPVHLGATRAAVQHARRLHVERQIDRHAALWARAAVDLIEADLARDRTLDFGTELRALTANDEWGVAQHHLEKLKVINLSACSQSEAVALGRMWSTAFAFALSAVVAARSARIDAELATYLEAAE
jgi:hypothetical protein